MCTEMVVIVSFIYMLAAIAMSLNVYGDDGRVNKVSSLSLGVIWPLVIVIAGVMFIFTIHKTDAELEKEI